MATYKRKVYGRVNRRYRTELREETRQREEPTVKREENVPRYLLESFGNRPHRRGNPSM